MERLTRKELCSYTKTDFYSIEMDWHSIYNKLAEFEDFMEEQGFEDLGTFRTAINLNQLMNKAGVEHFKENQALKARWEKLKEYVADNLEITQVCQDPIEQEEYWCLIGAENCYKNLQEKIQELE